MKRFLLGAASVAALSSAAVAADLPSRRAPPVYVPPPPAFTFTGVYVGFNVGGTFNDYTSYRLIANDAATAALVAANGRPAVLAPGARGVAGGVQIGYHIPQLSGGLGTVRGRLGYAFGNLLVFGTGGFAYADVRDRLTLANAAGGLSVNGITKLQTGYAYGGGVEYAVPTTSFVNFFKASAVTVKAEFIHYDLGSYGTPVADPLTGGSYTARIRNLGNIARIGVNYKFGSPAPAPVVARY